MSRICFLTGRSNRSKFRVSHNGLCCLNRPSYKKIRRVYAIRVNTGPAIRLAVCHNSFLQSLLYVYAGNIDNYLIHIVTITYARTPNSTTSIMLKGVG